MGESGKHLHPPSEGHAMLWVMSHITLLPSLGLHDQSPRINVADKERIASLAGGAAMVIYGLVRRSRMSPVLAVLGGLLIRRGFTGRCPAFRGMGLSTAQPKSDTGVPDGAGYRVEKAITIDRPVSRVFQYWRDLENLPHFMPHLKSVKVLSDRLSHWTVEGPAGPVEWDAEIINEHPDSLIAWQTLPGADVQSAGTVRFEPIDGDHRTHVSVVLKFNPPAGALGGVVARILGESPAQQLEEDLGRFKILLEAETIPESMSVV